MENSPNKKYKIVTASTVEELEMYVNATLAAQDGWVPIGSVTQNVEDKYIQALYQNSGIETK